MRGYARIYTSGCAKVGGMTLGPMYMLEGHQIPGLTKSSDQILHERQKLSLGKFKQQICAMWMGVVVTREEVIKYVANKLGGRHYDEMRRGDLALKYIALDRIRKYKTGYEGPDKKFLMDYVYFELLATGRFLTESDSLSELARQLEAER
jgi:hypothetical protein